MKSMLHMSVMTLRFLSSSPKVRTLAKALSPSFLRFGGTRQDFMVFTPQGVRQDSEDPAGKQSSPSAGLRGGGSLSCETVRLS